MDDISIFQDKLAKPTDKELAEKLGPIYELWERIYELILN